MAFNIALCRPVFKAVVESQIVIPQQSLSHNDTLVTQIYDLASNIIYRIVSYTISPQNQLMARKIHLNLLWH